MHAIAEDEGLQANQTTTAATDNAELASAAEAFMRSYAVDLRNGHRGRIAHRYDRTGVHELRPGVAAFTPHEAIVARYADAWDVPASFEWKDLSYEVLAPDTVLVTGLFLLGEASSGEPGVYSYGAILRRQQGEFRIRFESEAPRGGSPMRKRLAVLALAGGVLSVAALALVLAWLARRRNARRIWPENRDFPRHGA